MCRLALLACSARSLVLGIWPLLASLFVDLERPQTQDAGLNVFSVYCRFRTASCSALSHLGIARRGALSEITPCSKSSLDSLWTAEKYPLILSSMACIWLAMCPFAWNRRSRCARVCSTSSSICTWASPSSLFIFEHMVLWITRGIPPTSEGYLLGMGTVLGSDPTASQSIPSRARGLEPDRVHQAPLGGAQTQSSVRSTSPTLSHLPMIQNLLRGHWSSD